MRGFKKAVSLIASITLLALSLGSCGHSQTLPDPDMTDSPSPSAPEIYYNGAYGVRITIPEGWTAVNIDTINMTATPEASNAATDLNVSNYDDSGRGISMIELWNRDDTYDREHASLMLFVEIYDGIDEQSYLSAFRSAYAGEFDGYKAAFDSIAETEIGGKKYTHFKYSITPPESEDKYYEEYYVRKIEESVFFIAYTTHWDGNQASQEAASSVLSSFTLSK